MFRKVYKVKDHGSDEVNNPGDDGKAATPSTIMKKQADKREAPIVRESDNVEPIIIG